MNDASSLSEGELKNQINILRQQIDHKEREIKNLYHEMNLHNKGGKELRAKRDELNHQVKEVLESANEYKNKRDGINNKITELKTQREELKSRKDNYTQKIDELKQIRDNLNKFARGRLESLNNAYKEELEKFAAADIPLEQEEFIFKRLHELGERLNATKEADTIHSEMGDIYGKVGEFHQDMDTISALIRDLASESQEYHEAMLEIYGNADEIRRQSNEYHGRLMEIKEVTRPIKEKIDALKKAVSDNREELGTYLDRMKEIQLSRDQIHQEEKRINAKDKFQKQGRLSLEDLRLLMENNEIDFD